MRKKLTAENEFEEKGYKVSGFDLSVIDETTDNFSQFTTTHLDEGIHNCSYEEDKEELINKKFNKKKKECLHFQDPKQARLFLTGNLSSC